MSLLPSISEKGVPSFPLFDSFLLSFFLPSISIQFVFFAGGRVLPKHNAEGPAGAAAEVQVDQAGQGGRDVGTVVSRDCRKYRVWQCLDFLQLIQRPMWDKNSAVLKSKHCQTWDFLQALKILNFLANVYRFQIAVAM